MKEFELVDKKVIVKLIEECDAFPDKEFALKTLENGDFITFFKEVLDASTSLRNIVKQKNNRIHELEESVSYYEWWKIEHYL
jgi:hypothetical protein